MGAVFTLALLGLGIWIFAALVRHTKRKAAEAAQAKPWEGSKPPLLDATQRKRLGSEPSRRAPDLSAKPSRAMRTGWSLGTVAFTYADAAGDVTYRTVTLHSVTASHLKGECHDRGAERTFRTDRIIGDVVDVETGEVLKPRTLPRHFG